MNHFFQSQKLRKKRLERGNALKNKRSFKEKLDDLNFSFTWDILIPVIVSAIASLIIQAFWK